MIRSIILLTLLFTFSTSLFSQENELFNLGIGVGNGGFRIEQGNFGGYSSRSSTPSISLSYELPFENEITLAPYVGYNKIVYRNDNWVYNKNSFSNIWLGVKGTYYFDKLIGLQDKYDFYGGLALDLSYSSNKETSDIGSPTLVKSSFYFPNLGLHIGGRYWFNKKTSIYTDAGLGKTWLNIGATFKIN